MLHFCVVNMEFPSLGQRCHMADCQQLDFLPISCAHCNLVFCREHFQPFVHSCPHEPTAQKNVGESASEVYMCSLPNCSLKELIQMPCTHCMLHFCLQHRHQVDHQCTKLEAPKETMVQTAELVKQIQMKHSGKKSSQGAKSEKLAAKVQLMKLKQNSVGEKQLPADERVYFSVQTPTQVASVFVSKLWSLGKCIDFIASATGISNFNNVAGKPHLNLFTASGDLLSERKDALLSELFDKEMVFNGQSVVLKYVDQ